MVCWPILRPERPVDGMSQQPRRHRSLTLKQQAQELLRRGNLEEARVLAEGLCRQHKRDAESHYMLGSIHGQLGEFEQAAKWFRRAVELQPSAVVAHCGLGSALEAQGKWGEAEKCYRHALHLKSDFPDARLQLAGILLRQEKLSEAKQCLETYLQSRPGSVEALVSLGEIHHARRELHEAIGFYNQALAIEPSLTNAHYRLGVALHTLGALDGAIAHYEKALQLEPELTDSLIGLGDALIKSGRIQDAMATYDRILCMKPECVGAIVGKAEVYEAEGKYEAAHGLLIPLIERGVEHAGLGITFANVCRHFHRYDEAIAYLEQLLQRKKLNTVAEEGAHFALGKLYDAIGAYDQAFHAYQRGNSLRPSRFDPGEHDAMIKSLMDTFSHEFLAKAPRGRTGSRRPIFILGMPRSGTSLVEQILASHPDVFGAGELSHIGDFVAELAVPRSRYPHCFKDLAQTRVDRLAIRYLEHLERLDAEAAHVTDKLPQNFQHLGLIALLFPGARIVHCVRDARDTCLSIYFQLFNQSHTYATDLANIGVYYNAYERLMEHWKEVLDLPILEVSYADLVADQERMSRRLIEFCGLQWDDRCLEFHKTERVVTTCSYDQVRRPVYSSSVDRWRNYEKYLGPLLLTLG